MKNFKSDFFEPKKEKLMEKTNLEIIFMVLDIFIIGVISVGSWDQIFTPTHIGLTERKGVQS